MRVSGIIAAALISAALTAPGAGRAGADGGEFDVSAAPALAPGVGIGTYNIDTTPGGVCTAGWLVTDHTGRPGLLTAASCFHGGSAVFYSADRGYQGVGRFTTHDDTLAVLGINNARMNTGRVAAIDTRIIGVRPVAAPADSTRLAVSQRLCAYGAASHLRCGPITAITGTTITVAIPSQSRDAGAPVYDRGQAATPVGITIGGDDTTSSVALIGPWLHRWQLDVDTTPTPLTAAGVDVVGRRHS